MSIKEKFTQEEWQVLIEAISDTVAVVMGAAPSGMLGWAHELVVTVQVTGEYLKTHPNNKLVLELDKEFCRPPVEDEETPPPAIPATRQACLERLAHAAAIASRTASKEDADGYKEMLISLAEKVAMADKEGSFLGIGGVQVTPDEQEAIQDIKTALGCD